MLPNFANGKQKTSDSACKCLPQGRHFCYAKHTTSMHKQLSYSTALNINAMIAATSITGT
ncbi:hypothetical protein Tam1G_1722 [Bifidobacterium imperatoris]|uniref:Uncharacterized protein n=1 Tax=Bifidobacterium imperatoris TaxID=2020965 RepID=A0A2N5IQC8_9BIFI|nr:hypothetical protein Tam1G_1722 [Bifidobacterium imperatoris]